MRVVNTELLMHPSNWLKVFLMAATFFLGAIFVANNINPTTPQA